VRKLLADQPALVGTVPASPIGEPPPCLLDEEDPGRVVPHVEALGEESIEALIQQGLVMESRLRYIRCDHLVPAQR